MTPKSLQSRLKIAKFGSTESASLHLLRDVYHKVVVYLERTVVQRQVIAIVLVVLAAAFLTRLFRQFMGKQFSHPNELQSKSRNYSLGQTLLSILYSIFFPILGLAFNALARWFFGSAGYIDGLLISFTWVLSLILTFQLLVGIFYLIFTPEIVKKYQSRLLVPILIVVIFLGFLNQLANVRLIAEIVLTNLFNSPLTIRALFVATVGLYLWTVATNGVQDLVYSLLIRYTNLDPGGTKATLTLVRYILLLVGIGLAFSQFELDSTVIAAITGGLSVGIGFGLREILSNFISGILLLFERSLHPGDVIEVDNELSVVEEFSIRATTVRTKDNVELIIPNQTFLTSSFKTYTGTDRHVRLKMILRTDCNIEPTQVIKLIIQAAQNHPDILSEPASSVFLLEYGDNVATFQLNFWVDNPLDYERIKSELKVQLWDILSEHNVALPFPEIELHFPKQVVVASEQTPLMAPAG